MKTIVLSCSKNGDTFEPFHHCIEKYFPKHPDVVYFTDGIINPFYETIPIENELSTWTRGFREFLNHIDDEFVLLMIDDCFVRSSVDYERFVNAYDIIRQNPNVALMNFEKSWDANDIPTQYAGWKMRQHGSRFEVSIMCGIWNREKLLKVVERDCNPWEIEENQMSYGFDYFINSGDYIINWGYETFKPVGKVKGKWTNEAVMFLESEGFHVCVN